MRKYKGKRKEYDTQQFFTAIKKWRITANFLLKAGGIYIELGYNTNGIWKKNAEKIALGICNSGGMTKDVLIIVQRKYNSLTSYL